MFIRMSPYFPFSARLCLNQHHWLAHRMQEERIDFRQTTNAFLSCGIPTGPKNWPTLSPPTIC
jgi:hypothetical protein